MSNVRTISGTKYDLLRLKVDIEDTNYRSEYFTVSDLADTLTSGKTFFTINGSDKLKKNSNILVEVLDSKGTVLFYELTKSGYHLYRDTTDLVVAITVSDNISPGLGKIVLVGTTANGKSVRWSTNIKINPALDNSSRIIYLKTPELFTQEVLSYVLNEALSTTIQNDAILSGNATGSSLFPKNYSDYDSFYQKDTSFSYKLYAYSIVSTLGVDNVFDLENINTPIDLYVTKISYLNNENNIVTLNVSLTQSFLIQSVVNNNTVVLNKPFIYSFSGINQIVPVVESKFINNYVSSTYITTSQLITSADPDGAPNPSVFQTSTTSSASLREGFLDVTYKAIKPFTGKAARHKIYRRSLNKSSGWTNMADEPLFNTNILIDDVTVNRAYKDLGIYYNQNHISTYYYSSSALISMSYDSSVKLNSMNVVCGGLPDYNLSQSNYIILKNNSSLLTSNTYKSTYVPYDSSSFLTKKGAAYDSNFIKFYKQTNYLFSADLELASLSSSADAKLIFYLTGSYNLPYVGTETAYVEGRGIKLAEYPVKRGVNYVKFNAADVGSLFAFNNDLIGTVSIVPVNLASFKISNWNIYTYSEFGCSPDLYITRIPFPVTIKNEQFELKFELLDINSKLVYSFPNKIINFDPNGYTLYKNITSNYSVSSLSSSYTTTASWASKTISASYALTSSYALSSSWAPSSTNISSSYALTSSFAVSASWAPSSTFISASYALTSSYALTATSASYAPGAPSISASYALTSSYAITSSESGTGYNGNRTIKRSPYTTLNVGGTSLKDFIENFFFPFVPATVAISSGGTTYYETGSNQNISVVSTITANDEITFGSSSVYRDSAAWNTTGSPSPLIFTFTDTTISSSHTYQTSTQTNNNGSPTVISSNTKTATFIYPYLYGMSVTAGLSGVALYTGLSGKSITPQGSKTFNYSGTAVYMYFAYPASYSDLVSILDPNSFQVIGSFQYSGSVPVTSSGLSTDWMQTYKVYRTTLVASPSGNFIFS
jgi:hypothetical protein